MLRAATLAANARPFRYACYPVIALGFLLLDRPSLWPAATVLLWCLLWPLAVDCVERSTVAVRILQIHLLEAVLTCLLLAWAEVNTHLLLAVAIMLVASNALQGGVGQSIWAALAAALALCLGALAAPASGFSGLNAPMAFATALVLAYCAMLGHRAYAQALVLARNRTRVCTLNARLQQYLPPTLAQRVLEEGRPKLERRWLVVAFVDLAGFTSMVERLQVEELSEMLDSYLQAVASVTERCGGTLSKVLGDGAMLVFGEVAEADRRSLVAAALACCRQLAAELEQLANRWREQGMLEPVQLKVGIASGYCSLGDWGGEGRLEYTVIGHSVNLAARLEGLAGVGEVLVCERTGLLAEAELSPLLEGQAKGLGRIRFRKVVSGFC